MVVLDRKYSWTRAVSARRRLRRTYGEGADADRAKGPDTWDSFTHAVCRGGHDQLFAFAPYAAR